MVDTVNKLKKHQKLMNEYGLKTKEDGEFDEAAKKEEEGKKEGEKKGKKTK